MTKKHIVTYHKDCKTQYPHEPEIKLYFDTLTEAKNKAREISIYNRCNVYIDWNKNQIESYMVSTTDYKVEKFCF